MDRFTRSRFVSGAIAASALAYGRVPAAVARPAKEIVIGLDAPQSGSYADQGYDQLCAFNLAIDQINRSGGIMGTRVKAATGNDGARTPVAVDNARQMIEQNGASMITGGASTATAIAVSAFCQEKKTIYMAGLSHGDETTGASCHRHTFRRYITAHMSAFALARTVVATYGAGRWFHISADYSWGRDIFAHFANALAPARVKTIGNLRTPLGTADFSAQLSRARAAKPDVLVLTQFGKDMVNCLTQAAAAGLTKNCVVLVPLVDEYLAKNAGDAFEGVISTVPYFWKYHADKYPESKRFVDAFRARYGTPPSNGAECVYVNVHQYKHAVERAGSLDAAKVIAALEGWHFQETRETEYWRAGDHQAINSCLVIQGLSKDERNGDDFNFAKVLAVHDGAEVAVPESASQCTLESA